MLFIFIICTFQSAMYDDVQNISSFSDINLLLAIQLLLPSNDSKDFVDRPTKRNLKSVLADFRKIEKQIRINDTVSDPLKKTSIAMKVIQLNKNFSKPNEDKDKKYNSGKGMKADNLNLLRKGNFFTNLLKYNDKDGEDIELNNEKSDKVRVLIDFVDENFYPVGYDIETHEPEDYIANPLFIDDLKDVNLINMSRALQNMWRELSRVAKPIPNGGVSTLLRLPRPFMIPGGRFREFYYWDTYWILEGLIVSEMGKSAENIIVNFISIINEYGYIPNGTRKYYLYRSEPPFFCMMLLKLLDIENGRYNKLVLGEGLNAALKEYRFWDKYRSIEVDRDGQKHKLNLYKVNANFPRIESFSEDVLTYERQNDRTEEQVYTSLKSGAESGWDFSSRWFDNSTDIGSIRAEKQIPVDLNAILFRNEIIISTLLSRKGDRPEAKKFLKLSKQRETAINTILWNSVDGVWMDYLHEKGTHIEARFYFSNITPMIYNIKVPDGKNVYSIMKKYSLELFGYKGGVPVSGKGLPTVQQWDYPNVWAPHQHMLVDYLLSIKEEALAFHVAKSFFNSVYAGFETSKAFFEKYSCNHLGRSGGGGEYAPQTGFGWTNGAILSFIQKFKDQLMEEYDFNNKVLEIVKQLDIKSKNPPVKNNPESLIPLVSNVIINIKA